MFVPNCKVSMNATFMVSYGHSPEQDDDKFEQLVCVVPDEVKQGHTQPSCPISLYIIVSLNGRSLHGTLANVF